MSGWIFARGRREAVTLASPVAAGATALPLAAADEHFAPGDLLFCSTLGLTTHGWAGAFWLGQARSVAADHVVCSLPLPEPMAAGCAVWAPLDWAEAAAQGSWPEGTHTRGGVAHARSSGGAWFSAEVAEPLVTATLRLDQLLPRAADGLFAWLDRLSAAGEPGFAIVTPQQKLCGVRLREAPIERALHTGGRQAAALPLVVLGWEVYP